MTTNEVRFVDAVPTMTDDELRLWRKRYAKRVDSISRIHAAAVRAEIARRKRKAEAVTR